MSNKNKSFLDPNTILALALTFIIFLGWQKYMEYKYPKSITNKNLKLSNSEIKTELNEKSKDLKPLLDSAVGAAPAAEQLISFEDEVWSFDLSSKGMAINNMVIKKINKVAKKPFTYKNAKSFYATALDGKVLDFNISKTDQYTYVGLATQNGKKIVKTLKFDPEKYTFYVSIKIDEMGSGPNYSIQHIVNGSIEEPKTILFLPAFERDEFFVTGPDDEERKVLTTETILESPEKYPSSKLVSLGDQYFAAAFLNTGKLLPNVNFDQDKKNINIIVSHDFTSLVNAKEVEFDIFMGPKNVEILNSVSPELSNLINFMYLGFLARPILKGLNFFYDLVGNYGLAVIILTFLIRLLILPLAVSSFKSMKRMQVIQPELKKIKEKYKDQPQVINQKTMEIMRVNKVNPLGGCLPMLLQMPIFFAFYRGLSESVDLYQAPFFGWITDLSKMDPYFLFPVLSMVGMTIHQLITPSTMDKMQKRMMMIMPIVFGLLFVTLPSALTLYMAVSTWFGIAQHAIFLRDKPAA